MSLENLRTAVDEMSPWGLRIAAAGGWSVYLVGGVVRDLLLGRRFAADTEVDMTTDARPAQIKAALEGWVDAIWTQGERFGTVGCRLGDRVVEVTTHRADVYVETSRKPSVSFGDDVHSDLSRRDFTINAMAVRLPAAAVAPPKEAEVELLDPFGGVKDLSEGVLRTPLAPEESFSDDPLRMLRAARFVSSLGVVPHPEATKAMTALAERLSIVSSERLSRELELLMGTSDPAPGVRLLNETGMLREIFARSLADDELLIFEEVAASSSALVARLSALLWSFEDASEILRNLRFSTRVIERVASTIEAADSLLSAVPGPDLTSGHQNATSPDGRSVGAREERRDLIAADDAGEACPVSDAAVRRWAAASKAAAPDAIRLTAATVDARCERLQSRISRKWLDEFAEIYRRLSEIEELDSPSVPLSGREVMAELNVQPGPVVGEALRFLEELRIIEGPQSAAQARASLRDWHRRA